MSIFGCEKNYEGVCGDFLKNIAFFIKNYIMSAVKW